MDSDMIRKEWEQRLADIRATGREPTEKEKVEVWETVRIWAGLVEQKEELIVGKAAADNGYDPGEVIDYWHDLESERYRNDPAITMDDMLDMIRWDELPSRCLAKTERATPAISYGLMGELLIHGKPVFVRTKPRLVTGSTSLQDEEETNPDPVPERKGNKPRVANIRKKEPEKIYEPFTDIKHIRKEDAPDT